MKRILSLTIFLSIFSITQAQKFSGKKKDINTILENIKNFSQYYMDSDFQKLSDCYTLDAKIFPNNTDIIEGRKAIKERWILPKDVKVLHHKITPKEITIKDDIAYDYGYYEGKTQKADGNIASWRGKYVIVWKKIGKEWKIYLDIWNRIKDK